MVAVPLIIVTLFALSNYPTGKTWHVHRFQPVQIGERPKPVKWYVHGFDPKTGDGTYDGPMPMWRAALIVAYRNLRNVRP